MSTPSSEILPPRNMVDEERPWLGLRSFTEDVSQYFFGRDREIPELADRIRQRPLTILYGQSGLGKTSLLNAGVLPRLRQQGYAPVLVRVIYDPQLQPLSPEEQVLREFAIRFPEAPQPATAAPSLWDLFHDPQFGFAGTDASLPRPVLVFDQFEEIFTLGLTLRESQTRAFFEALACVVENRPGESARARLEDDDYAERVLQHVRPCRVVFAMRDDYLHQLERWRRQMPSMMDNRCELRRLTGRQAFDAAFNPGLRRRDAGKGPPVLSVQTAEQIVRLAAGKEADVPLEEIENVPPLLSLMCEQLNYRRLREKQETIESANLEGSADEVLRDFCRDSFRDCHPAVREFVEQRLVSGAGIRQSVNMETAEGELRTAGVPQPEKVLRILVDRRLLTVEDRGGISRLELTHDILAPVIVRSRNSGTSETTLQAALDVYASLSDASAAGQSMDQRLAERLFRSLAQFGPTGETVRRQPSLSLAALAAEIGENLEKTISVAEKFSNRGILVLQPAGTPAEPDSTVDVEHRALFSDSRLLAGWITQETQDAEDFRGLLKLQRDGVQVLDSQSLERAVRFFDRVRPTAAWARRWLSATASEAGAAQSLHDCQQLIEKSRQFRNRVVRRRRLWIAAVIVFLIGAMWFWQAERARQESINVTQRYLANPAAFLEELKQHQQVAVPILQEQFAKPDPAHPEWQLHAAWGLARYQPTEQILQWLAARVPKLSAEQFRGTAQALQDVLSKLNRPAPTFVKEQLAAAANNRKIELRWLLMGLALGETQRLDRYCRAKPDPSDTTQLMLDLPTVPIDIVWLSKILDPASSLAPETRYLLCLVVGGLQGNAVAAEKSLEAVFIDAKDPGSHAAARWALQQQGRSADELEKLIADRSEAAAKDAARDWYVTPPLGPKGRQVPGLTMVSIPSHPEFILGSVTDYKDPSKEDWREWGPNDREPVESFWMSDREISNQQILAVLEDDAAWATKEPRWQLLREQLRQIYRAEEFNAEQLQLPADGSWNTAVASCNLFSIYEGLEPAYRFAADAFEAVGGSLGLRARAGLVQPAVHLSEGNGYRLPLEREWEYACRTLSSSEFAFGNGGDKYRLDLHAVWDGRPLVPGGSLRPSRWGMFDLYGSTAEWCSDWESESLYGAIEIRVWLTMQLGNEFGTSRVLRGGSFDYGNPDIFRSADRSNYWPDDRSGHNGFRFSRTK